MLVGSNWAGDFSRFTFDELKQYYYMLKEQGKPVLDDEFNLLQEILLTKIRRLMIGTWGNGTNNNGFLIVGSSADNNFTIKGGGGTADNAGYIVVDGYYVILPSDETYLSQPISQSALTTPGANRTDEVYLDVWLNEIDGTEDINIIDPSLNIQTGTRLKLEWEVKVAEGSTTPVSFTDGNNARHHTYKIATLNRTAQAAIDAGMVVDNRNDGRIDTDYHESKSDPHPQYVQVTQAPEMPFASLDYPTVDTSDNRITITPATATNGGTVSIPADVLISIGEEVVSGETGRMKNVKTLAFSTPDLDVSSTYYLRAKFIAGTWTVYTQKGTDADVIPVGLLGTVDGANGGGFDSTVLDILFAKIDTKLAGIIPVVTEMANKNILRSHVNLSAQTPYATAWTAWTAQPPASNWARTPEIAEINLSYVSMGSSGVDGVGNDGATGYLQEQGARLVNISRYSQDVEFVFDEELNTAGWMHVNILLEA